MPDQRPLVTLVLHKFSRGGSDRVAAYLARGFVEAGLGVELVVFSRGGEVEQILLDLVGDVQVHYLGAASGSRLFDLVRGLLTFARHIRESRPDVVLSTANNTALASFLGLVLARNRSSFLILKTTNPIAGSRHRGVMKWLRSWSYRRVFKRAARVWTLSEDENRQMQTEFPDFERIFEPVIQPYVTDPMLLGGGARTTSSKLVLSIARLTPQKRLDRLIQAFAHVQAPGARLVICGEGEERERLSRLAQRLGVQDRVAMPGYVPDVTAYLSEADVLVLTSDYEGLPAAALEAMASNCSVLSTDCFPCARSLLENAPGCEIIQDDSPSSIGATLDAMLSRPRPVGLSRIAERYSIANGVESHLAHLREVLGTA